MDPATIRAMDPATVVADDIQITDMVGFCTSSIEFGIPTFSLGEFDITPITYSWKQREMVIFMCFRCTCTL